MADTPSGSIQQTAISDIFLGRWLHTSTHVRKFFGDDGCQCVNPGHPEGTMCQRCDDYMRRLARLRGEDEGEW